MELKKCLFSQPAGAGDIFLLIKAAQHYTDLGYQVIWPLLPQLMYIKDYVITPAEFIDISGSIPEPDLYIDFQNADRIFSGSVMEAKYKLIDLDYSDWVNYFHFNRNIEKENALFNHLNLEGKKYTLVSKKYGTPPNFVSKEVYLEGDNEVIEVDFISDYNIFDWCKVIEEANQISMVETGFNFIIEKLNLKAEKMFMISKHTPPNFIHITNLFQKPWIKVN